MTATDSSGPSSSSPNPNIICRTGRHQARTGGEVSSSTPLLSRPIARIPATATLTWYGKHSWSLL